MLEIAQGRAAAAMPGLAFMMGLMFVLSRLFAYLRGTAPPISLLGRLRTGRFIVPGYDLVFVIPVISILVSLGLFALAESRGLEPVPISGAIVAAAALLNLAGYPQWISWQLTGHFRHKFTQDATKSFVNLGSGQPTDGKPGEVQPRY